MEADHFQVRGNGCTSASRPIRFVQTITALGLACAYQRAEAITGTYTTHPEDAKLNIDHVEFTKVEGSIFCPGSGFLDMSFTLERDTGRSLDNVYIKNHS